MPDNISANRKNILALFLLSISMIGVLLALFWNIAGFFMMMSILSILTHVPTLNIKIRKVFLGIDEEKSREMILSHPQRARISNILGTIIILFWIGQTIFAFFNSNVPLIEIFVEYFT